MGLRRAAATAYLCTKMVNRQACNTEVWKRTLHSANIIGLDALLTEERSHLMELLPTCRSGMVLHLKRVMLRRCIINMTQASRCLQLKCMCNGSFDVTCIR